MKNELPTYSVNAVTKAIQARINALPERKTQLVRAVRREFSKQVSSRDSDFVLKLALNLLKLPDFEFRFIAYELVQHHRKTALRLEAVALEKLGNGMDSWQAVDCFSSYLAGPAWREGQITGTVVRRWARSSNRWWRRAALVATVPLNNETRGGSGDATRTLDICRTLIDDREPMVVKALSWALRELAKRDAASVSEFVEKERDRLAPQVLREVQNKLVTGLKNPRKADQR